MGGIGEQVASWVGRWQPSIAGGERRVEFSAGQMVKVVAAALLIEM